MKTPRELKLERELKLADGLIKQLRKDANDNHCKMKLQIKELKETSERWHKAAKELMVEATEKDKQIKELKEQKKAVIKQFATTPSYEMLLKQIKELKEKNKLYFTEGYELGHNHTVESSYTDAEEVFNDFDFIQALK